MNKYSIYFDTSIINFLFAGDAPEKRDIVHKIDILLSWNFRHLANINKERKFLIANFELGYTYSPRLTNPMEVFND